MNKVQIEKRLIHRIGVREWGYPTVVMPGQIWRSERRKTISCMVRHVSDITKVTTETLPLEVIDIGELSIVPDHWRDAILEYVKECPHSGAGLSPFLRITEADRNFMIRKLSKNLSDNIGCRATAHAIGLLAAFEFELVEP